MRELYSISKSTNHAKISKQMEDPNAILTVNDEFGLSIKVILPTEQVLNILIDPDYRANPKVYITLGEVKDERD